MADFVDTSAEEEQLLHLKAIILALEAICMWLDDIPLKEQFPDLYAISTNQYSTVEDCYSNGGWNLFLKIIYMIGSRRHE
ncbi:hypothetical protein H5410_017323 [Solanum commersonii]|uniref:Uncharacterized protein n=1 Tax=Solanum commersonii TaxID=4109 RepID=A0A9J5ZZM0_SOLCO|nr:hypothetical protein H5410_017323 [Solanum commersonii]